MTPIQTPTSVRIAQRRLDRLTKRALRVEEVVADMAAGLSLHRAVPAACDAGTPDHTSRAMACINLEEVQQRRAK